MSIYVDVTISPLAFSSSVSGSMPNINIDVDTLTFSATCKAVFSSYPAAARNPDLDIIYYCNGRDAAGDSGQGFLNFDGTSISGTWLNSYLDAGTLAFDSAISGSYLSGSLIDFADDATGLAFDFSISGEMLVEMPKTSWVKWSKIGYLDFTIDHSNQAGERPMDWAGEIYNMIKKNNLVVVYGSNGISIMTPVQNTWSYKNVYNLGTKGRDAQIGLDDTHWFVDSVGQLWEYGEGLKKLDYSSYLNSMGTVVLSLNEKDNLLYICDGTSGYVYNYVDRSFGKGPINVTGYGYVGSTSYVVSPATIADRDIAFTTNVYDFGTRKEKTIFNLEISTAGSQVMQAAINYRVGYGDSFTQTPWVTFTSSGIAYLPCYGREFQFKFKTDSYTSFSIDQFKVNGVIHGFSFLDTVRKEN